MPRLELEMAAASAYEGQKLFFHFLVCDQFPLAQEKFAASLVSPLPLYFASCG